MNQFEDNYFEFNQTFKISKVYLDLANHGRTFENQFTWDDFLSRVDVSLLRKKINLSVENLIQEECLNTAHSMQLKF